MEIHRIEAFAVRYPTQGRFKFLEGPDGTPLGRPGVIIKITADDGTVGWGESVPMPTWTYETLGAAAHTIENYFTPVLIGRDPFDIVGAMEEMNRVVKPGFTMGMPLAKAGVDIALHDLCCKKLNCSLQQLWGRKGVEELTISWTLNPINLDTLEASIEEGWNRGFRNFNTKVAPDPKYDIELCRIVKERVPDGFLWADANTGYTLADALYAAPRLADIGVDVLEAPIPPNMLEGHKRLRQQGALPILMDEGVISPREVLEFYRLGMHDGVAVKPSRCGGLLSCKRQMEILEDAGMMILGSGLTDPDISLAATLALYGAFGMTKPAALNGPQFLAHSVITQPIQVIDGKMKVPAGPGLGVEVDEAKIGPILAD